MTPAAIHSIRKRLGLSQAEAGEVIGGGPRGFGKYEAGTVRPSASVIQLLRLLDANPRALTALQGGRETGPFEVNGERLVATVSPQALSSILHRLLSAEAQAHGLSEYGIHVAHNITAPDGGEDGRIEWMGGPDRTTFLPARLCQFQLKTGDIYPSSAAKEVVGREDQVKPMVRSVLEQGGHYILLCTRSYTQQQIQDRKNSICTALHNAGMEVNEDRIHVRSAEAIAAWINRYPSVAIWVNEQTDHSTVGPFRSWSQWEQRTEHENSPWVEDERLPALREPIRNAVAQRRRVVRVVGTSGVGKSRLALEALASSEEERKDGYSIADLVMYADLSETAPDDVNRAVQALVDNRQCAVLVVDSCPPQSHRILADAALQNASRVSLITIDHEIPSELEGQFIIALDEQEALVRLREAPPSVVEAVIGTACPGLPSEDFRRLARFSQGNPKIGRMVARAWAASRPVAYATDERIAEAFVAGDRVSERDLVLRAVRLLAAFRLVALDTGPGDTPDDLCEVAEFGDGLTEDGLRSAFERMIDRGVVQRRGRFVTLEPRAIGVCLAARQWRDWGRAKRQKILGGKTTSPDLKVNAAKQLALLNTAPLAREVVEHVCCLGGPFDGREGLLRPGHAEVLHYLAQIDSSLAAEQIKRALREFTDLRDIRDEVRRDLVWALEKIAFEAENFEVGARLLLRLALAENEHYGNNATGQFKALFPVILGNTAADGEARLDLLKDLSGSGNPAQQTIIVEALIEGSATHHFSRSVGAETHGARAALSSWHPPTQEHALAYLDGCVELLANFATGTDAIAYTARRGLGKNLRSLASDGFIDLVEQAVTRVAPQCDLWPEASEALGHLFTFDLPKLPQGPAREEIEHRIQSLIDQLEPQGIDARVRFLVTEMSWDYLLDDAAETGHEELHRRQADAVCKFAAELMEQPGIVKGLLPQLCRDSPPADGRMPRRMTYTFGNAIAGLTDTPLDWLDQIIEALRVPPEEQRDFNLLAGYLERLRDEHAATVETFKQRAAGDPDLAPALPFICFRLGIVASDIDLVLSALHTGLLPPWRLTYWSGGGALKPVAAQAVAPLFDALLDYSAEGYRYALELMAMYAFQRSGVLADLRPQLRKSAENLTRWPSFRPSNMTPHHFETLMKWLLAKGRDCTDARAAAVALSSALVRDRKDGLEDMVKPLIRPLLETFPDIAWQTVGATMLSNPVAASRLGFLLGERLSEERNDPPILALPEEVLFAWCRANPKGAAAFAAATLPFLDSYGGSRESALHPRMARLIDEFGDRVEVRKALDSNVFSGSFWGSAAGFYGRYDAPLSKLRDGHLSSTVRRWAGETLRALAATIEQFNRRDDEWNAQNED